jgi:protein-disulfide isomerase
MSNTATKGRVQARQAANEARRRKAQERQRERRRILILASAGVLLLVAVVVAAVLTQGGSDDDPESSSILPAVVGAEPLDATIPQDGRTMGDPNAPLTMVEWGDYQCPGCGYFNREVKPRLIEDYVKTGKMKFEFRDLPFLDTRSGYGESDMPAEAAACAGEQGRFWDFHDTIYSNQFGENQGAFSRDRLIRMAEIIGLDVGAFTSCFEDRKFASVVQSMQAEAEELGISSTPTLVVNGTIIRYGGATPDEQYADLKRQLDAMLAGQ